MTDPISDLVVRIKNANKAHIPSISFSSSSLTSSIAEVLKQEGYIENYKIISHNKKKTTIIDLKYKNLLPVIHGIKQISKPPNINQSKLQQQFAPSILIFDI